MSTGLMSCVRESSPPLKMSSSSSANSSGPLSLPTPEAASMTSAAGGASPAPANDITSASNGEQQKRRRFHPLRNLRRIFRRRTITSVADTSGANTLSLPPSGSTSEKNLRSATLTSIVSTASASSPSSPLNHQQLQDSYVTHSLPKSKSHAGALSGSNVQSPVSKDVLNSGGHKSRKDKASKKANPAATSTPNKAAADPDMYTTTTTATSSSYHQHLSSSSQTSERLSGDAGGVKHSAQRQSFGVAVLPSAMPRNFFAERQMLRSMGDSSQDLDSSSNESHLESGDKHAHSSATSREMSDSRRSLSEGRLIDSDYSQEPLSQSHDSVFSESATASSLSIVLKAELADVLRKRRSRPDASDEDLGLPRSPVSPQRRGGDHHHHVTTSTNVSGRSTSVHTTSTSLAGGGSELSLNSNEAADSAGSAFPSGSLISQSHSHSHVMRKSESLVEKSSHSMVTTTSTKYSKTAGIRQTQSANFDESRDVVDLFGGERQRLSHAAAKHKMAIRPVKKKGPSRHRRTLETSIPETSEDSGKSNVKDTIDAVGSYPDKSPKSKTEFSPVSRNVEALPKTDRSKPVVESTPKPSAFESNLKRSKTEKLEPPIASDKTSTSTSGHNLANSFSATNLFGLRHLTTKASAMFEHKETSSATNAEGDRPKAEPEETAESGFLRRLMHRNSKRTIAKVHGDGGEDDDELNQSEPKKIQISLSSYEAREASKSVTVEKSQESFSSTTTAEVATTKESKWDAGGISTLVSNFMSAEKSQSRVQRDTFGSSSSQKPKSGPAARQRYAPQDVTFEKKLTTTEAAAETKSQERLKASPLKQEREVFASTSMVREVTSAQTKVEHHFEKKPKIVGLSAFQQKVSRSNDSLMHSSLGSAGNSVNSLETEGGESLFPYYDQKQRKSVEKSRSFRTYDEKVTSPGVGGGSAAGVHNNMPSLPDLTSNLRLPGHGDFAGKTYAPITDHGHDKSVSLGFEINDNNLVKPVSRAESSNAVAAGNPNTCATNVILTNSGKYLTPSTVLGPSLSPTATSCSKNIFEIEQNIDLIVKSPFVSVLRKSATGEKLDTIAGNGADGVKAASPTKPSSPTKIFAAASPKKERPQVLNLKETSIAAPAEKALLMSPRKAAAAVTVPFCVSPREVGSPRASAIETVVPEAQSPASKGCTNVRRTSNIIENTCDESNTDVPEFMKIQLNRVRSPAGIAKSNVVLAKNVKESEPPTRTSSNGELGKLGSCDDLSSRRSSNESMEIIEKPSPEKASPLEAINRQAKATFDSAAPSLSRIYIEQGSPKSATPKSPGTPSTPPTDSEEAVVLRVKKPETNNSATVAPVATNKLSLQERKRLFLAEEAKSKSDKKIEEIRQERKKSLSEEISRKSVTPAEEKPEAPKTPAPAEPMEVAESPPIVLRKKSFGAITKPIVLNGSTTPKEDGTPELIKVFARRSLKVKDEDLEKFVAQQQTLAIAGVSSTKKTSQQQQQHHHHHHVDSDKENQSASEEKLDKLPYSGEVPTKLSQGNGNGGHAINRNSVADFRHSGEKNGIGMFNGNNNSGSLSNGKSHLPPIKVANFRTKTFTATESNTTMSSSTTTTTASSVTNSNNNNSISNHTTTTNKVQVNNNNNNMSKSLTSERQAFSMKFTKEVIPTPAGTANATSPIVDTTASAPPPSAKVIERSATVSEFKGIHQRRAEWEQRAKEAFK